MEFRKHTPRIGAKSYGNGTYSLDDGALKVLEVFAEKLWTSYLTGKPLSREFCYPPLKNDWRQNLYYRFYKDYIHGNVEYEFDVDAESLQMASPAHLSALTRKFTRYASKEV
jgi:hypothetical protein